MQNTNRNNKKRKNQANLINKKFYIKPIGFQTRKWLMFEKAFNKVL